MNRRFRFLVLILLGLLLSACSTNGLYHFTLVTDGEHKLDRDLQGDLLVFGGKAILPENIELDGSAHVLSGSLVAAGEITGDVSLLNGDLTLEPSSRIRGNLNLGGGTSQVSPGAVIEGKVNKGTGVPLPELPERRKLTIWETIGRSIIWGVLLGWGAAALMRYFPAAVHRVGEAAVHHSLVSGAMGLLVGIVGLSVLVTIAYTILLIPITFLGLLVLAMGVIYGWIGLGVSTGRLGVRLLKRPVPASRSAFFGTLAFVLLMEFASSIPFVGGLIGLVLAMVGMGAVFLTRFGLQSFTPAADDDLSS
jgi:hypothetical protein